MSRVSYATETLVRGRWQAFTRAILSNMAWTRTRFAREVDGLVSASRVREWVAGERTVTADVAFEIGERLSERGVPMMCGAVALHAAGYYLDFIRFLDRLARSTGPNLRVHDDTTRWVIDSPASAVVVYYCVRQANRLIPNGSDIWGNGEPAERWAARFLPKLTAENTLRRDRRPPADEVCDVALLPWLGLLCTWNSWHEVCRAAYRAKDPAPVTAAAVRRIADEMLRSVTMMSPSERKDTHRIAQNVEPQIRRAIAWRQMEVAKSIAHTLHGLAVFPAHLEDILHYTEQILEGWAHVVAPELSRKLMRASHDSYFAATDARRKHENDPVALEWLLSRLRRRFEPQLNVDKTAT